MTTQPTIIFTFTLVLVPDDRGAHLRLVIHDEHNKRSRTLATHDGDSSSSDLSALIHRASNILLDAFSTSPLVPVAS